MELHFEDLIPEGVRDDLERAGPVGDSCTAEEGLLAKHHNHLGVDSSTQELSLVLLELYLSDTAIVARDEDH